MESASLPEWPESGKGESSPVVRDRAHPCSTVNRSCVVLSSNMRDTLKAVAVIALTVALMAFFLRSADLSAVWAEIVSARPAMLLATLAVVAVSYVFRVWRWQLLLAPIGRVGFGSACRATVIGFATTAVLPGRLGEVLRPYLVARRERLSASAALATVVLERLLDLLTVTLLLGLFLFAFGDTVVGVDERVLAQLKTGGLLGALGALGALGLVMIAAGAPERTAAVLAGLERRLPGAAGRLLHTFLTRFGAGFGLARSPGRLLYALLWSLPLWLTVAASAWTICQAFGIALPPSGSLLVMVLMVLGVSVPTPAGAGGFHALFQIGVTSFYGAPNDAAVGAALVLHAISFGPVTVLGIVWMVRDGLSLRSAVDLASGAGPSTPDTGVAAPRERGIPVTAGPTGSGDA